jgi:hypothetical protein
MDKLTKNFIKLEGVLVIILGMLVLWALCSCTKTEYITVEKVRTDTTYINKVQRDSIYLHDSTFVKVAGDTVWIERWHTKWQNHVEHDTVYKARADSVPVPYPVTKYVEKPRSTFEKGIMGVGILSIMALVVFIAFKLKRFLP